MAMLRTIRVLWLAALLPVSVQATTPRDLLAGWQREAGGGFSAQRGRALFSDASRSDWSCATCHTADPRRDGRHVTTSKSIAPLAPGANPARFTDPAKVEKWFRRNCRDVLRRECTAMEKGDVLTWLLEQRP